MSKCYLLIDAFFMHNLDVKRLIIVGANIIIAVQLDNLKMGNKLRIKLYYFKIIQKIVLNIFNCIKGAKMKLKILWY